MLNLNKICISLGLHLSLMILVPPAYGPQQAAANAAAAAAAVTLDAGSFRKAVDASPAALVMFHAPWCPHCQEAKPKFVSAAKELRGDSGKLMAMVDCAEAANEGLCAREKVEGYPTFKFYRQGELVQDFEDDPSEQALLEFIRDPPKKGEKRPPAAGGRHADDEHREDDEEGSEGDTFMEGVSYLVSGNYTQVLASHDLALVFYYAPWCPHCQDAKPHYVAAAKTIGEKRPPGVVLATVNCDRKDNRKLCEGAQVEGFPTIRLFKRGEFWAEYEDEMSASQLVDFVINPPREKSATQPSASSSSTPSDHDDKYEEFDTEEKPAEKMKHASLIEGPGQFAEALKSARFTFVMFYAPWCPHCKRAKPGFDSAAERLMRNKETASVARLLGVNCDIKINQDICADNSVDGFPILTLFDDGKKKQNYGDPITGDDIVSFIEKLVTSSAAGAGAPASSDASAGAPASSNASGGDGASDSASAGTDARGSATTKPAPTEAPAAVKKDEL